MQPYKYRQIFEQPDEYVHTRRHDDDAHAAYTGLYRRRRRNADSIC